MKVRDGMRLPELTAAGSQAPPCSESLCIGLELDITIQIHTRVVAYNRILTTAALIDPTVSLSNTTNTDTRR
jgi:hypothetical protein